MRPFPLLSYQQSLLHMWKHPHPTIFDTPLQQKFEHNIFVIFAKFCLKYWLAQMKESSWRRDYTDKIYNAKGQHVNSQPVYKGFHDVDRLFKVQSWFNLQSYKDAKEAFEPRIYAPLYSVVTIGLHHCKKYLYVHQWQQTLMQCNHFHAFCSLGLHHVTVNNQQTVCSLSMQLDSRELLHSKTYTVRC